MKRLFVALSITAALASATAGAATDVAAVAHGTGLLKHSGVTCTAPLAVTLNVRSNQAVVTENWGSGSPGLEACGIGALQFQYQADTIPWPSTRQCSELLAVSTGAPFTLAQTGQTYTLQSTYTRCNGKQVVDKVVVTVQPARLLYSHTYSEAGVALITVTATLPRVA